ncbi:MAG: hypothetical protein ACTS45_01525 [Candidatus Hodgkinia cicadicola]
MPFIFEPNHNVSPEQTSNLTFGALDWWLIHFPRGCQPFAKSTAVVYPSNVRLTVH